MWQAGKHRGAQVVNEHGSLNFNNLNTRDVAGARPSMAPCSVGARWSSRASTRGACPAYGDRLEQRDPGMRERMGTFGAPNGFENVVAALVLLGAGQPDIPAHWSVTFAVDDADVVAKKAASLGGRVVMPPVDAPWVRMTVISDPQGATFTASKFVPENSNLAGPSTPAGEG